MTHHIVKAVKSVKRESLLGREESDVPHCKRSEECKEGVLGRRENDVRHCKRSAECKEGV